MWQEPQRPGRQGAVNALPWIVAGLLAALLITGRAPGAPTPAVPETPAVAAAAGACLEPPQ